jgi:RimJ/RimL family protein N-acetyltransferase
MSFQDAPRLGPRLETARLILRPTAAGDFPGWCALLGDPESARFLGGVQGPPAAWRSLVAMAGSWALYGFGMFSVLERESGRWIGRVGPWQPEGWPGSEVGWGLVRDAWGQGYAQEAAVAAIDWAFERLRWREVVHVIAPQNLASIRLAERLGSVHRGPTRLPPPLEGFDVHLWGQSAEDWRRRPRPI